MGSQESHLEVQNHTSWDIVSTSVSGCDNFDWDGNARPDRNFQGVRIPARGGSVSRREEVNKQASHCPFNMTLRFSDGSVDAFRVHQKHALGCCSGFDHYTRSHDIDHWRSGITLVIKVKNTNQQNRNEQAEERNRQGEAALRQKRYEEAMRKFDEAIALTNQSSTVNRAKVNKSEACKELGKLSLTKAAELENNTAEDKSQEASQKFNEAKKMFQQAQNLRNTSENQKNLNLVNLKIDGNKNFNEGNDLERQGFELFEKAKESGDFASAENKYKEAMAKYEEAVKKFEEGMKVDEKRFAESAKVAKELVEEVKKVLDDVDKAELNYNIGKVKVDEEKKEKKEEEEIVNKNLQQQIDG